MSDQSTNQQQEVTTALHVKVMSPDKLVWEGDAESVSSVNAAGPFDILPLHANFITIIEKTPIRVTSDGKTQEYSFDRSVIYAHENQVRIYSNL